MVGWADPMTWIEAVGYLASALVFASFCMRTMIPLRLVAMASNVCFVAYGFFGQLYPVLILHLILFPMNCWRTVEMIRLVRRVEAAARGDVPLQALKPFLTASSFAAGHVLFSRGDDGNRLFFILAGEALAVESNTSLGSGDMFGEIALFSPSHQRTQTARCLTDVELLSITEQDLAQVCYQNPAVCFHLLRLIASRLLADVTRLEGSGSS